MEDESDSTPNDETKKRSNSQDSVEVDDKQLIEELAKDYSNYMNFDLTKEQNKFGESIEDMLTKLDEFCGLVDMIRSDTTLCLTKTVPEIHSRCAEMEAMFDKIDKLETFVAVVKQSVGKMEECVGKAEDEFSSIGGFMKKITSIVSPKRSQDPENRSKQTVFVPPEIFTTSQYLAPTSTKTTPTVEGAAAST